MFKNNIKKLIEDFYRNFAGLPNDKAIVRNNIPEDAFTLAILKVMYSEMLGYDIIPENIEKISKVIVAPPDSGIDIFIESEDGDEYYYDVIQAKYSKLTEEEIRGCFLNMKESIKQYLKNPNNVQDNLKYVISETNFNNSFKKNCTYYVYHNGTVNCGKNFKNNEKIITIDEMEVILGSLTKKDHVLKVPYAEFTSDMFNNYIIYENASDNALLCNIRGYDLAVLCNKYINSSMGRNILFGQNLRDSLDEKKSKTYEAMIKTINDEPERFWNYNNGITILCESLDAHREKNNGQVDLIEITNFSIINGAQTTNALGVYLRNALINHEVDKIERLKKVYVLVRIMEVNNETLSGNISIYNNLQNPISSRDMVAKNYEQIELQNMLMSGEPPHIFVEIRRGQKVPLKPRFEKHQRVTNEDLAQLAFSAFLQAPFKAKDKKKTLFNKASSDEYLVNTYYDEIFYRSKENDKKGVLFKKNKDEIDEALFIKYLYMQARNRMRKNYDESIEQCNAHIMANSGNIEQQQKMIQISQRNKEINNTCMFYCIALYFALKENYSSVGEKHTFDYHNFYRNTRNSTYRDDIIEYFAENFLKLTVKIMSKLLNASGGGSATNWLKKMQSQTAFFDELMEEMTSGLECKKMYVRFIEKFTI